MGVELKSWEVGKSQEFAFLKRTSISLCTEIFESHVQTAEGLLIYAQICLDFYL